MTEKLEPLCMAGVNENDAVAVEKQFCGPSES